MSHTFDPTWLLVIPFLAILIFAMWALWNFSGELRKGKRRRVRSAMYGHQVKIYIPDSHRPVLRFRRRRDDEAA